MKYSSKQKLAMAMAASMVVSMAPAMAFAADQDFVNVATALGKEEGKEKDELNEASAKAVLEQAKALVNGDMNAQALVDAYEASIKVFMSKTVKEFDENVVDFKAKAEKVKAIFVNPADFDGGFGKATMDKHDKKRADLVVAETPVEVTATYTVAGIHPVMKKVIVKVELKNAKVSDVTAVKVNGKAPNSFAAALNVDGTPMESTISVITEELKTEDVTAVELTVGGKDITAAKN